MLTNLATNKHNTGMVLNEGLSTSKEKSPDLNLCGDNKTSPLLDSIDSKKRIKNLMASQKYHKLDVFLTFTYNMKS